MVRFETKAAIAMCGTFGHELDAAKIKDAEVRACRRMSELYHRYYDLHSFGDYCRLNHPFENVSLVAWAVSKDNREALVAAITVSLTVNGPQGPRCGSVETCRNSVHRSGIRPCHILLDEGGLTAKAEVSEMLGNEVNLHIDCGDDHVVMVIPTMNLETDVSIGKAIRFPTQPRRIQLFDKQTQNNPIRYDEASAKASAPVYKEYDF